LDQEGFAMPYRLLASLITVAAVASMSLAPVVLAGQGAAPHGARGWTQPRTPDGQPDLQGFWSYATFTPLERPKGVTKEFYSPEEAAKIEAARLSEQSEAPDSPGAWLTAGPGAVPRKGTIADVHYDFSQFGLDPSQTAIARTLRTSLVVDPPDGKIPALTAEGRQRAEYSAGARLRWDAAQSNSPAVRCIIIGAGPPIAPAGYNSNYQIVQGPGYVMILVEMIHDARIVPLDGRPPLSKNIRQWMGSSRGRWEGTTLVVETTNFNGNNPFRGSSKNMRVTERFTRIADDTIVYRFTVDDPTTWMRPWTAEVATKKTVGPLFEHACHEGNYSLPNSLSGARTEEKRAGDEAAKKELK
jgi:hypothetical protein